MIYRASVHLADELIKLPETGMGYQFIEAKRMRNYFSNRFIVFNGNLIIDFDYAFDSNRQLLLKEGYMKTFSDSDEIRLYELKILSRYDLLTDKFLSENDIKTKGRHKGTKGAKESNLRNADGEKMFVRLSAYQNDKRIDFTKRRLLPGSYTTTEADYVTCRLYKDNPIDRYALPNEEEVKWAFFLQPLKDDCYREGIVQPANKHLGGGIEDFFDYGTSENTYLFTKPY